MNKEEVIILDHIGDSTQKIKTLLSKTKLSNNQIYEMLNVNSSVQIKQFYFGSRNKQDVFSTELYFEYQILF
ncbi:hypothetical protein [Tenacibaculum sp. nBUS_03]|uniref:hypothetical protein n=1 Tax=Tenacibaculum sp. nBUS_03 TaxID=3395320 RepID=UPI003EBC3A49